MTPSRVLIITNIITPYRIPLFNLISQDGRFELLVATLAYAESNRAWKIDTQNLSFFHTVLPGLHGFIKKADFPFHLNAPVSRLIRQYDPKVVILSGYDNISYWEAMLYCRLMRKRVILWNGTTMLSANVRRGPVALGKRWFVKSANRYVAYGTKAAEYLVSLGANPSLIHTSINTVDMDWFRQQTNTSIQSKVTLYERSKYSRLLLLYVGRLTAGKGIWNLIKAIEQLRGMSISLLVVGDGPMKEDIVTYCHVNGLQNISFEGYVQSEGLPKYYAMADALVVPSIREVWGLVVNEALASGLYVLCSNKAAAGYDLIKQGWSGRLFNPLEEQNIISVVGELEANLEDIRARRQSISQNACDTFGIARSAQSFIDAIHAGNSYARSRRVE